MEFIYLFKALNKRKWIILLCVVIAVAAAYVLTMNETKQYKSVAQIATGYTSGDELNLNDDRFNVPQIEAKFSNLIETFNSPRLLSFLSYNLLLHDLTQKPAFTNLTSKQASNPLEAYMGKEEVIKILNNKLDSGKSLNKEVPKEAIILNYLYLYGYDIESIKSNMNVARVPKTDFVNISYISENPELSAYAVNNMVTDYQIFYLQNRRQISDTSIASLDSVVQQKKAYLDQKIAAKSNFMTSRGIVDVTMEGSSKLEQINSYQSQLTTEKGNRENLQYRIGELSRLIKEANSGTRTTTGNSGDNLDYILLKKQYSDSYNEYIRKGGNDPVLKKHLDDLKARMQQLQPSGSSDPATNNTSYVDDLKQKKLDAEGELKSSNQKISSIQAMISSLKGGLTGMASEGAGVEQLEREIQLASAAYTKAKERLSAAINASETGANKIRQTMMGQPALTPENSHRALKIALAGGCALFLSSLVVMLLAFVDNSIKTPSNFNSLTHLQLLWSINKIKMKPNVLEEAELFHEGAGRKDNVFLEQLRKVRYEIENSGKKIFLFTSTEPQQGKTTLIQALAYSLSLVNKRVLIIDTNFCNNDLTSHLSAQPVLEQFHANGHQFTAHDVDNLITRTSVPGVDMIGCKGGNYTPREILPQNHLLHYLPQLTNVYDFIFLEGAPLNDYTDTKELIQYSEGVVAVFSSEASLTPIDKESISFFKENKEKFLGAILNKVQYENLDM